MMRHHARRLFRSGASNNIDLELATRTEGALEARPILTFESIPVKYVMLSPIEEEEKKTEAGIYKDAELRAVFESFVLTQRPEFHTTGRMDVADRVVARGVTYEIVSVRNGSIAGLTVTFLYLKRTRSAA